MAIRTATDPATYEEGTAVSAEEYERIALADSDRTWELHDGRLREKPAVSVEHNDLAFYLAHVLLQLQLDRRVYRLRVDAPRMRRSPKNYDVPDVAVVPTALDRPLRGRPGVLEAYDVPLPLVVEVWSKSTGRYDVNQKVAVYQRRGDAEIWRLHPYERTLTVWRRQPTGEYTSSEYNGGAIEPVALPGVRLDLNALFDSVVDTP